ncbi:MAG TPA: CARDB domain-containing protein [Phycisphaerae bacterium]|nr:CARDB domain-containing protein [Phycisphaerae bacterium]
MFNPRKLSRSTRRKSLYQMALETLEPRQLLAADLTATITAFGAGPFAVGTKQPATLHITNSGNVKAAGSIAIDLYGMITMVPFDQNAATFLGRVNATISLNASASQDINLQVPINPALGPSPYVLNAVIDSLNKIAEADETNNAASASTVFTATALNADLVPSFGTRTIPSGLVEGDTTAGTLQVIITNSTTGTDKIVSPLSAGIQVIARTVGVPGSDVVINKSAIAAAIGGLAPGKSKTTSVPLSFVNLTAGTYEVIAKIDSGNALTETSELNNEIDLGVSFTVAPRTTNLAISTNAKLKFPTGNIVFDGAKIVPLKFDVAVDGNRPFTSSETFDVTVVAHPHDGSTDDIAFPTFSNIKPGAIAAGKSKTITLNALLPFGGTTNDYDFVATLTSHLSSDSGTDNTATTSTVLSPLHIARGLRDLQVTVGPSLLPTSVVHGQPKSGGTKIDITNIGNVALPAVQHVNLALDLHPNNATDSTQDIHIGILNNQSVAKLAPNAKKTFTVNGTLSQAIASDHYTLIATATPVEALTEELLTNNSASGATIVIADPFVDLDIATATQGFAANVLGGAQGSGKVTVANLGNVPASGHVDVQFYATTTGDIADGVVVGDQTFTLNLLNGKTSSTFTVPITLPTGSESTYTLVAKVTPTDFTDTDLTNNAQAAAGSVHASEAHVDLAVNAAGNSFGAFAHGGDTGTLTISVGNLGNIAAHGDATVTFYATTDSSLNAGATNATAVKSLALHNLSINASGVTTAQKITIPLANPNATVDLKIFARITAGTGITDSDTTNNDTLLATVSTQHVDLPMDARFGNTIKFTSTSSFAGIFDSGTFVTNTGLTGTYYFPYTTPYLALNSDVGSAYTPGYGITFTRNGFFLGGKTYTFSFNPAGSVGTVNISGNTVYYK